MGNRVLCVCATSFALSVLIGCKPRQPPSAVQTLPASQFVFDQTFDFADGGQTQQGQGFFVRSPRGTIVAVTSAHFLDQSGPKMTRATWTLCDFSNDPAKSAALATSTASLGLPGNAGIVSNTRIDLRADYAVFRLDIPPRPGSYTVLELDPTPSVLKGERFWFVAYDVLGESNADVMEGVVDEGTSAYLLCHLTKPYDLMGLSGSPLVSQRSGKVIGTLSRGAKEASQTVILAAPGAAILAAIAKAEEADDLHRLPRVIGRQ